MKIIHELTPVSAYDVMYKFASDCISLGLVTWPKLIQENKPSNSVL